MPHSTAASSMVAMIMRIITGEGAGDEILAQPGDAEGGFDENGARGDVRDLRAKDGDQGDEGVLEHVARG